MADNARYPQLPNNVWWALRRRFVRSIPSSVTPDFLAAVLEVKEAAARVYLNYIKIIGLVDEDGKPTDLAYDWRTDEKYSAACKVILESVYPDSLLDVAPFENASREEVTRWFMNTARSGEGSAKNRSAFYVLVANPSLDDAAQARKTRATAEPKKSVEKAGGTPKSEVEKKPTPPKKNRTEQIEYSVDHRLNISIQIYISPDSSAEQIDRIFSSMAKHLGIKK